MITIKFRRKIKKEAYPIYDLRTTDIGKEISIVGIDGNIYTGFLKSFVDDYIILSRPDLMDLGFPVGGIMAWFYADKKKNAKKQVSPVLS